MTELSSQLKRRLAQIQERVSIVQLLAGYGYPVREEYGDREQQLPCDLHGDGKDGRFSARVYPESNTVFCFACNRGRDPVALVREKEFKGFLEAIRLLERRFDLPFIYGDEEDSEEATNPVVEDTRVLSSTKAWEEESTRLYTLLLSASQERLLPLQVTLKAWNVYDQVAWGVHSESMDRDKAASSCQRLRVGLLSKLGASCD